MKHTHAHVHKHIYMYFHIHAHTLRINFQPTEQEKILHRWLSNRGFIARLYKELKNQIHGNIMIFTWKYLYSSKKYK